MLRSLAAILNDEIRTTLTNPKRVANILRPAKVWAVIRRSLLRWRIGDSWMRQGDLEARKYRSYEDYITHQHSKLEDIDFNIADYDVRYCKTLRDRLNSVPLAWTGKSVLCLAARIGTEVKAFTDLGAFAIGIDLNPGKENRYVVTGDFHDIQFASQSVDVIFTNSLDHAFSLEKLVGEVKRVLKQDGVFFAELGAGRNCGFKPGAYESLFWSSPDDVAVAVQSLGLSSDHFLTLRYAGGGKLLAFRKQ